MIDIPGDYLHNANDDSSSLLQFADACLKIPDPNRQPKKLSEETLQRLREVMQKQGWHELPDDPGHFVCPDSPDLK
jgi:hypothetical protein